MKFRVNQPLSERPEAKVAMGIPLRESPIPKWSPTPSVPIRKLFLYEGRDRFGRLKPLLGTVEQGQLDWFAPVTETPRVGDPKNWEQVRFVALSNRYRNGTTL